MRLDQIRGTGSLHRGLSLCSQGHGFIYIATVQDRLVMARQETYCITNFIATEFIY